MNNLISKLRAKKDSKKGFTLMEMLIVVAIIAILVAVSIPVFTTQLDKARVATDDANMRAAKAVAITSYLTADDTHPAVAKDAWYDIDDGKFVSDAPTAYGKASTHKDMAIKVTAVTNEGVYTLTWTTTK